MSIRKIESTVLLSGIFSMEQRIVSEVRQSITDQVLPAVEHQQTSLKDQLIDAMRSTAATPVPTDNGQVSSPDPQVKRSQILALLRQGQLNAAFQVVSAFRGFLLLSGLRTLCKLLIFP